MVCYRWWTRSAVVAVALALSACALNPIRVAETVEQKAYATYGTYVIVQEQAVKLTTPASTLTPTVKTQIINAFKKAQPVVDSMMKGFNSYQTARDKFEKEKATATTAETDANQAALVVSVTSLDGWVTQAQVVIADLVSAVKGAQR